MHIIIKGFQGLNFIFSVDSSKHISDLKDLIKSQTRIPNAEQILNYQGTILEDNFKLEFYEIVDKAVINLTRIKLELKQEVLNQSEVIPERVTPVPRLDLSLTRPLSPPSLSTTSTYPKTPPSPSLSPSSSPILSPTSPTTPKRKQVSFSSTAPSSSSSSSLSSTLSSSLSSTLPHSLSNASISSTSSSSSATKTLPTPSLVTTPRSTSPSKSGRTSPTKSHSTTTPIRSGSPTKSQTTLPSRSGSPTKLPPKPASHIKPLLQHSTIPLTPSSSSKTPTKSTPHTTPSSTYNSTNSKKPAKSHTTQSTSENGDIKYYTSFLSEVRHKSPRSRPRSTSPPYGPSTSPSFFEHTHPIIQNGNHHDSLNNTFPPNQQHTPSRHPPSKTQTKPSSSKFSTLHVNTETTQNASSRIPSSKSSSSASVLDPSISSSSTSASSISASSSPNITPTSTSVPTSPTFKYKTLTLPSRSTSPPTKAVHETNTTQKGGNFEVTFPKLADLSRSGLCQLLHDTACGYESVLKRIAKQPSPKDTTHTKSSSATFDIEAWKSQLPNISELPKTTLTHLILICAKKDDEILSHLNSLPLPLPPTPIDWRSQVSSSLSAISASQLRYLLFSFASKYDEVLELLVSQSPPNSETTNSSHSKSVINFDVEKWEYQIPALSSLSNRTLSQLLYFFSCFYEDSLSTLYQQKQ